MTGFVDNPMASERENAAAYAGWEMAQFDQQADPWPTDLGGDVETESDVLRHKLAVAQDALTEVRIAAACGWCAGTGIAPPERFGRDEDGAPHEDENQPCPDGCAVPEWIASEFAYLREEIARLTAVVPPKGERQ